MQMRLREENMQKMVRFNLLTIVLRNVLVINITKPNKQKPGKRDTGV